jgi:glycoprotein-N-acetylgalactosamine 3-beta-galactosyltransferase
MENMRFLLARYSPDLPIYFGKKLKNHVEQGWMTPRAGVVFSRAAVRRFVEKSPKYCRASASRLSANIKLGECMETLGVIAGDARDAAKQELFHLVNPLAAMFPSVDDGRQDNNFYVRESNAMSGRAIAFHHIGVHEMYELEFLVNDLEVYGHIRLPGNVPGPRPFKELMASFVENAESEEA